jgi:hypothetical protein
MSKPQYVRVTDESGWTYSVVSSAVEAAHTVLDNEPATDGNGDPLPASEPVKKSAKSAAKES